MLDLITQYGACLCVYMLFHHGVLSTQFSCIIDTFCGGIHTLYIMILMDNNLTGNKMADKVSYGGMVKNFRGIEKGDVVFNTHGFNLYW